MIVSVLYTLMYLEFGIFSVRFLLPRHRPLNRIWLGLSLGLLEEMWLPVLCAFLFGFAELAHVVAAWLAALITLLCMVFRDRRDPVRWDEKEEALLKQLMMTVLPLTVLSAFLQYTHTMRVDEEGAWHVGQSTLGDLPMHLSFITGLVGKKFPADYPLFPGQRLSYPFLADSLSSTFYLFGASLQAAAVIPAVLMMVLCFTGVMILAREMTAGKKTVIMAALLFFLNGGLGFLYNFDLIGENMAEGVAAKPVGGIGLYERVTYVLKGYYQAPTNRPDLNLRWSNVICDLMIPQRTLLGGWCMVIPCFYLLNAALRPARVQEGGSGRALVLLGVWGGALPLIHTHSFLALALMSLGAMVYDLIHGDPPSAETPPRPRSAILARYVIYGVIAAALALPQLICFTFDQALNSTAREGFLKFQFNWVNNPSGEGMRDMYFWFWIKNVGLPFIALILALFGKNPRHRRIFAMMVPVILAAEFIRFQPNEYDNNKLFYLAWLMGCMIVADWFAEVWRKLNGLPGRGALAALVAVVIFLSAGMTVWRECLSDYVAFTASDVAAADYARNNTPDDAVYLAGSENHLNPVASVAGKTTVCGPNLWLYWHGLDTRERRADIYSFYADPAGRRDILDKYGVSYIYVSRHERENYPLNEYALRRNYTLVFENDSASIYSVEKQSKPDWNDE